MSHKKCKAASLKCVLKKKKQPVVFVVFHSLLPHTVTWPGLELFIQSEVYRKPSKTWAQHPGGHSSASVLAPERRTAAMKSVVYLEMNLQHPHPSDVGCSPQRRAHPCTYRRFLPISVCECRNVCSFKSVSLYVRLSFANVKGLSWTEAPEICSSSSSEQLLSVLTSPHPAASRVLFQPSAPASLHFSSLLFTYQRMYKEQSVKSRF